MSLALKFTSLAVRTFAKPIANQIKKQAREHEGFKRVCVNFAQALHRVDMRWRIGLLQDAAEIEKQASREAARDAAKKHKHTVPTVKTEAQTKADEEAAAKAAKEGKDSSEPPKRSQPRIRPLSEAKAIETGANFISESFLFGIAASLIFFEAWRSRRKDSARRDDVTDRLADLEESEKAARRALIELEHEVLQLRAKHPEDGQIATRRILPKEVYEAGDKDDEATEEISKSWLTRVVSFMSNREPVDTQVSTGPAEAILAESDKALIEKQKKRAQAEAEAEKAKSAEPRK